MARDALTSVELRAVSGLASLYGLRMLGLFMVLPVMPLLLQEYEGATPLAIGLVIGIYGFTQALLQLPFGWLSDRFGRKPLIYAGLVVFALGSLVAATADSLLMLTLGRALQGAGAIASVLMALLADLTRDERRTQAMATVGISIGLAFIVAMAAGPWLAGWLGLSGLFWLTALLSVFGMLLVWRWVPSPMQQRRHLDAGIDPARLKDVVRHPQLLRLDLSILLLHLLLTGIFLAVPLLLQQAGWTLNQHGWIYLLTMLLGFFTMIPLIIIGEKGRKMKAMLLLAVGLLLVSLLIMTSSLSWLLLPGLWIFFTGFNLLEASLPSLISKQAPVAAKGTAMGVYSTSQFLGAFVGGVAGGWVLTHWDATGVLFGAAVLCGLWLVLLLGFQPPRHLSSRVFSLQVAATELPALREQLLAVPGVVEVVLLAEESAGYLKLDRQQLDEALLDSLLERQG
ncbi:MFS transporter [Marinospirillum alkaliphilum]|uniref:Predicted arabinose efflux permease, MFS family n=1 Tax=Marinospirillum alkaliphilum DSM 21637 TaxID=1122209 RepID=A0A1K1Z5J8_9GAMM|nr:MFS transporter [Marinospirillum alkaliphilum]SFX69382.1 Predicted arabinose efflux permease, MFS family [Marinospirillum alkaliphilum DSM 21637]